MRQRAVGQGGGFVGEGGKLSRGELGDQPSAGERAGFLVGIDQHVIAEAGGGRGLFKGQQRMEHHRDPALHIGNPGAVQRLLVEPALVLERVIGGEDGVHMTGQQDPPVGLRAHAHHQMLAMRLVEGTAVGGNRGDGGRVDQFDAPGQGGKRLGQRVGLLGKAGEIGGAGVDRAPRAHLRQHRAGVDHLRPVHALPLAARARQSNPLQSNLPCAIGRPVLSSPGPDNPRGL